MNTKVLFTFIILTVLIICLAFALNQQIARIEEAGSDLPPVSFRDKNGLLHTITNQSEITIILIFNGECDLCRLQLKIIEQNIQHLAGTYIYLLSTEAHFFEKYPHRIWPGLRNRKNFIFGTIDRRKIKTLLGKITEPMTIAFDSTNKIRLLHHGILNWKKWQKIL